MNRPLVARALREWRKSNSQFWEGWAWWCYLETTISFGRRVNAPERSKATVLQVMSCEFDCGGLRRPQTGPEVRSLTCSRNLLSVMPSAESEPQRKRISPLQWLASLGSCASGREITKRHNHKTGLASLSSLRTSGARLARRRPYPLRGGFIDVVARAFQTIELAADRASHAKRGPRLLATCKTGIVRTIVAAQDG